MVAIQNVQEAHAAKIAAQMEATKLAQAIMGLIKKGIKPSESVAEAAVTSLSQTDLNQKVLDLLAELLKGPPVDKRACPIDSTGDAYFAGRKVGCVFGTPTNPIFKLKLNGTNQTSWKGWKLVLHPTSNSRMRFDFVKEEYVYKNKKSLEELAPQYLNKNLSDSILAIIKGHVHPKTVNDILTKAPPSNVSDAIIAAVKAALAGHVPKKINAVVQASSSSNLVNKLVALITTPVNTTTPLARAEGHTGLGGFLSKIFKGTPRFPTFGSFVLNPLTLLPQFIDGIAIQRDLRGYFIMKNGKRFRVFQRGSKLVSEEGHESESGKTTENAKGRIAALIEKIGTLAEAIRNAATVLRNSKNTKARQEVIDLEKKLLEAFAELKGLYQKMFKEGGVNTPPNNYNAGNVSRYLYSSEFAKMSSTARSRKLAELLKKYPPRSKARDVVKTRVLEEIRNAGQNRNASVAQRRLQNLRTNIQPALSLLYNRNLTRALGVEGGRAVQNLRSINEYPRGERRSERRGYDNYGRRYGGEKRRGYDNYGRRSERRGNYGNEVRRRRTGNGGGLGPGNGGGFGPGNGGPSGYANNAAAALPTNQKTAITNAGGVRTALNTVAGVPGGATEVAKAAEALNEMNGNATKAVNIKGASPTAVQAVQKLGGPNNAVYVLHGLNTLSQKPATIRRKAVAPASRKRKKPLKIRVAELNRVIEAVKKQKLISLVAHNVTKTHNIHPNDEKKKKYYKKVIKAEILRTKFAKIVKKSAHKT